MYDMRDGLNILKAKPNRNIVEESMLSVLSHLSALDWTANVELDKGYISFPLLAGGQKLTVFLCFYPERNLMLLNMTFPDICPPEKRNLMARLIIELNGDISIGNFDINMYHGGISLRQAHFFRDVPLSEQQAEYYIGVACSILNDFAHTIIALCQDEEPDPADCCAQYRRIMRQILPPEPLPESPEDENPKILRGVDNLMRIYSPDAAAYEKEAERIAAASLKNNGEEQ